MRIGRLTILVLLSVLALTACHHGSGVSVDGKSITLRASGAPKATITAQGDLSKGAQVVDTTPQQRQMLAGYYRDVTDFHRGIETLRDSGLKVAGKSIGLIMHELEKKVGIRSASSAQDKASAKVLQAKSRQIAQVAMQMCTSANQVRQGQTRLVAQIPALKPYAGVGKAFTTHCNSSQMADMRKAAAAHASTTHCNCSQMTEMHKAAAAHATTTSATTPTPPSTS